MAIPSLADIKATVSAAEIAPYEADITAHLETAGTVEYLETAPAAMIVRTYPGKVITPQGIEALKAALTAAGWLTPTVVNGHEIPASGIGVNTQQPRPQVTVTFKPPAATPPEPDTGG
ncbi:virion structural protein [Pseudomonas phage 201phi2-1]|uniref:Virion structural protein n=1 Tax=Pseudomonas phage 201phi2-1 TaxID=198110 RepID=B3FJP2_BP201|nr:virion structural protein [Pseudomonas phage 201phi2-1]ABY63207.1 virion structural protein [Pseudomonas phage 201phi2-1]